MDKRHSDDRGRPAIRRLVVSVSLMAVGLSACGRATPAKNTASAAGPPSQITSRQSASPLPSSTPSHEPTPRETPTELAPPRATVFYDLSTAWIPYGDATKVKRTRLTLVIQKLRDGAGAADVDRFEGPSISHSPKLEAPSPLELDPGKYEVTSVIFPPKALGTDEDITTFIFNGKAMRLHGPTLTVPDSGCVYLGALTLTFVRVEPTMKTDGQWDLIAEAGQGATLSATLLPEGSLLWFVNDRDSISVTVDPAAQKANGAEDCEVKAFKDPLK